MEDETTDTEGGRGERGPGAMAPTAPAKAGSEGPASPPTRGGSRWAARSRLRVLLYALLLFAVIGAFVAALSLRYWTTPVTPLGRPGAEELPPTPAATPTFMPGTPTPSPALSPAASPSPFPSASPTPTAQAQQGAQQSPNGTTPQPAGPAAQLLIPVAGVRPEDLRDTYTESRSEGRAHNAIDIMAPCGAPVLAAAAGKVIKLFQSVQGGTTAYQLAGDGHTIYYYAHLARYADGLTEGHFARRGETIAYVGDTGNAKPGNCHLHFSVSVTDDPKHWSGGTPLNPYPLLKGK